ncbi:hypothetical protein QAD02_011669 [Eretmocerus hayati]|uniref:Uncharacterized protein n=1 Tax=Eretmocerus hayati TaxID=131215 RepID=A0ACC2NYD7_9HYME|nr:hypothetical protein QAD02_011669 [Eretmocerus hayati]
MSYEFFTDEDLLKLLENDQLLEILHLLKSGLNPDSPIKHYGSLLNAAIVRGHDELIDPLLNLFANVNVPDETGKNSIYHAVKKGRQDLVQKLLWFGADLDMIDDNNNCLLSEAISRGNNDIVIDLIHDGIDISQSDPSMLFSAAQVRY